MLPRTDILTDLTNIKLDIKDEQNSYHLSKEQKYNANLVAGTSESNFKIEEKQTNTNSVGRPL